MKEVVISTEKINCYGGRILTAGIDLSQYRKNPVLLWMHRRCFNGVDLPLGRIENLRIDGDRLIGTPVFDQNDEFAKKIESKWENGFLRMASAGVEILETSDAPELLLPGQTRHTITRCRLDEVSIVDIGGNDDALQLYRPSGKRLELAAGVDNEVLPLLESCKINKSSGVATAPPDNSVSNLTNKSSKNMNNEILQLLGLAESASEQEAVDALRMLKEKADKADSLILASITAAVDSAVDERRITADQKEHFLNLGKSAGIEALQKTLALMRPAVKPSDVIHPSDGARSSEPKAYAKLSDVPESEIGIMRDQKPAEYARLYKAEYGTEPDTRD